MQVTMISRAEAGWYVGNTPSIPRLNIPPILMQDAGQGFFFFSEGPLLFAFVESKIQARKITGSRQTHTHTKRRVADSSSLAERDAHSR